MLRPNDPTCQKFASLFEGNLDAYGKVWGESVKFDPAETMWPQLWFEHLAHNQDNGSLGVYPMFQSSEWKEYWDINGIPNSGQFVRWGCTDLDDGYEQSLPQARNLEKAAAALRLEVWTEKTKGKGYHVWLFSRLPVPANMMRNCLLALHQVAGVAPTEVNPKQTSTDGLKQGLGNYVNLVYAYSAPEGRRVMIDLDTLEPYTLQEFLDDVRPNEPSIIMEAASLYVPPKPKAKVAVHNIEASNAKVKLLAKKLSGLAYTIWKDGPLEGRDRSTTLARLVHLMAEDGKLSPSEGFLLLKDADARWGKHWERDDCEVQLTKLIEVGNWGS